MKRKCIYRPSSRTAAVDTKAIGFSFFGYEEADTEVVDRVAILRIEGPLEHKAGWFWDSYEAISDRFSEAIESRDVDAVVLSIDSPGGDVSGLFETIRWMRETKAAIGKPVVAHVNEMACSAGYALACACDEIWLPDSGTVGSIGILAMLADVTQADALCGFKFAFVTSGARKTDGNPHTPISGEAVAAVQKDVDALAAMLFGVVSSARGIDATAIQAMQAATYLGMDAVAAGLADDIGSLEDAIARASALATGEAVTETETEITESKGATAMPLAKKKAAPKRAETVTTTVETTAADPPAKECPNGNDDCDGGQECVDGLCQEAAGDDAASTPESGSGESALSSLVATITGETSPGKQMAALVKMHTTAKASRPDRAARVNAAIKAGKVTPALRTWAMKLDERTLDEFLGNASAQIFTTDAEEEIVPAHETAPRQTQATNSSRKMIAKTLGVDIKKLEAFEKEHA